MSLCRARVSNPARSNQDVLTTAVPVSASARCRRHVQRWGCRRARLHDSPSPALPQPAWRTTTGRSAQIAWLASWRRQATTRGTFSARCAVPSHRCAPARLRAKHALVFAYKHYTMTLPDFQRVVALPIGQTRAETGQGRPCRPHRDCTNLSLRRAGRGCGAAGGVCGRGRPEIPSQG